MKLRDKGLIAGSLGTVLLATALLVQADESKLDPAVIAIDLDTAKAVALTEFPGSVVEAELEKEDGKIAWEFEIVAADGTRMELLIDANSGELIGIESEDEHNHGSSDDDDDREEDHDNVSG